MKKLVEVIEFQHELLKILKDHAVNVLHSICQKTWKTQQQPWDWQRSVFIPIPNKNSAKNVQGVCAQSCLTICDLMDYSQPGLSAHGFFQARILEWVVISFYRESCQSRDECMSLASPALAGRFFSPLSHQGRPKMFKLPHNCAHFTCQQGNAHNPSSQASIVCELRTSRCTSWVRKGRGTRGQIAKICCI